MEKTTALGRLVVPDEVVAAIVGRHAIATAAIAGLVRPGGAGSLLGVRHLSRGVGVGSDGPALRLSVCAAARYGIDAAELNRAAAQTAEAVAASIGGDVGVEVEIRVAAVRVRRRVGHRGYRAEARIRDGQSEGPRA